MVYKKYTCLLGLKKAQWDSTGLTEAQKGSLGLISTHSSELTEAHHSPKIVGDYWRAQTSYSARALQNFYGSLTIGAQKNELHTIRRFYYLSLFIDLMQVVTLRNLLYADTSDS